MLDASTQHANGGACECLRPFKTRRVDHTETPNLVTTERRLCSLLALMRATFIPFFSASLGPVGPCLGLLEEAWLVAAPASAAAARGPAVATVGSSADPRSGEPPAMGAVHEGRCPWCPSGEELEAELEDELEDELEVAVGGASHVDGFVGKSVGADPQPVLHTPLPAPPSILFASSSSLRAIAESLVYEMRPSRAKDATCERSMRAHNHSIGQSHTHTHEGVQEGM